MQRYGRDRRTPNAYCRGLRTRIHRAESVDDVKNCCDGVRNDGLQIRRHRRTNRVSMTDAVLVSENAHAACDANIPLALIFHILGEGSKYSLAVGSRSRALRP